MKSLRNLIAIITLVIATSNVFAQYEYEGTLTVKDGVNTLAVFKIVYNTNDHYIVDSIISDNYFNDFNDFNDATLVYTFNGPLTPNGLFMLENFYEEDKGITVKQGTITGVIIDFNNVLNKLSTEKVVKVENLNVYPNPVVDVLNISFTSFESVPVTVTDMNGRDVYNEVVSASVQVDMSFLPSGVYIAKINNETKRVIKQ